MSRDRKYRAWDVRQKKMLYKGFALVPTSPNWSASRLYGINNKKLQNLLQDFHTSKDNPLRDWGDYDLVDWTDYTEFIVMDWIGRNDKNDEPVFEDDILICNYGKHHNEPKGLTRVGVVAFDEKNARYVLKIHNSKVKISFIDVHEFEKIGNIHEDANLLKETKK